MQEPTQNQQDNATRLTDMLQSSLPFIAGVIVLIVGLSFNMVEAELFGLGLSCFGFYLMVKPKKSADDMD